MSLGPTMRLILALMLCAVLMLLAGGTLLIIEFREQVTELTKRKRALDNEIIALNSTMQDLENEINTQRYAFERLNELEELTRLPFLDSTYSDKNLQDTLPLDDVDERYLLSELDIEDQKRNKELLGRITKVKLSLMERTWLLNTVPNGHPMPRASRVTSNYGMRRHPVTHTKQFHYGMDFAANIGDQVHTTADGVVKFAGKNNHGYGLIVVVTHSYGFETRYAHLDEILVTKGEFIAKGTPIGKAGNTGISTGPHLHYEIEHLESRINPRPFVSWNADNYNQIFKKEKNVKWLTLVNLIRNQGQLRQQQLLLPAAASLKAN